MLAPKKNSERSNFVPKMNQPETTKGFRCGDTVWAKMGNYSFWPAIISDRNDSKIYFKNPKKGKLKKYHVTFFGDKMSTAWIIEKNIQPLSYNHLIPAKLVLPKSKKLNVKFYRSILEARYFLQEARNKDRLTLLDILYNSCKLNLEFNGFLTVKNEQLKNKHLLYQHLNKICGICLKSNEPLFKCNDSCAAYYHLSCDFSLETDNSLVEPNNENLINADFKCNNCRNKINTCFFCKEKDSRPLQKCSVSNCEKLYHSKCIESLKLVQFFLAGYSDRKKFYCPDHMCVTCCYTNETFDKLTDFVHEKLIACVKCPTRYHNLAVCVPAGTVFLSPTSIVCHKHFDNAIDDVFDTNSNMNWCLLCSKNGELIYCKTCPNSFHLDCLEFEKYDDSNYYCKDCQNNTYPRYGEIVWTNIRLNEWWPGLVLFPSEIPAHFLKNRNYSANKFAVQLLFINSIFWHDRKSVFSFHEDDNNNAETVGDDSPIEYKKAVEIAADLHAQFLKKAELTRQLIRKSIRPPVSYRRIRINSIHSDVKIFYENDLKSESYLPCNCKPFHMNPCGINSSCINRMIKTECDKNLCPAGNKCENRHFNAPMKRSLVPFLTENRGWGLKTLKEIAKDEFVIEYVGEVIGQKEYERRLKMKQEHFDYNYYFLTIDPNRLIDAGAKGNLSRFINHSCEPNCSLQNWWVNGELRAGLFAFRSIAANEELTFNYNLKLFGNTKMNCFCGSVNCSGIIGQPAKMKQKQKDDIKAFVDCPILKNAIPSTKKPKKGFEEKINDLKADEEIGEIMKRPPSDSDFIENISFAQRCVSAAPVQMPFRTTLLMTRSVSRACVLKEKSGLFQGLKEQSVAASKKLDTMPVARKRRVKTGINLSQSVDKSIDLVVRRTSKRRKLK